MLPRLFIYYFSISVTGSAHCSLILLILENVLHVKTNLLLTKYHNGDNIKEHEMGRTRSVTENEN
jgi:hypothetical protein